MPDISSSYLVLVAILVVFNGTFLFAGVCRVPPGVARTIERFGRYHRTLGPGFHMIIPFAERVGVELPVEPWTVDLSRIDVETSDRYRIPLQAALVCRIVDVPKAAYEVNDLEASIRTQAQHDLVAAMATVERMIFVRNREAFAESLAAWLQETTAVWGVDITRMTLEDAGPHQDLDGPEARRADEER